MSGFERSVSDGEIEWALCDRETCGLEVVRPGKVQCWCEESGQPGPLWAFRQRSVSGGQDE